MAKKNKKENAELYVYDNEELSFYDVIDLLIDVCNHSEYQAEQCAVLIHDKGKYCVKRGEFDMLERMANMLVDGGLDCDIEVDL